MECQDMAQQHLLKRVQDFKHQTQYKQLNQTIADWMNSQWSQTALQAILHSQFTQYYYDTSKEFLCAKVFKNDPSKRYQVYTCFDCREECNSIFCEECFEVSKHIAHKYQRQSIKNGICDCGDTQKWKEETFCSRHTYQEKQEICPLSNKAKAGFKEKAFYLIQLLCWLYQSYLRYENSHVIPNKLATNIQPQFKIVVQHLAKTIDSFGTEILSQLIFLNKNRQAINRLSAELMNEKIQMKCLPMLQTISNPQVSSIQVKQALLIFTKLKRTPSKCVQLFMLLFFRNKTNLREEMTVQYLNRFTQNYSFSASTYSQFSPQLISNSLVISSLAKNSQLPLFLIENKVDWHSIKPYAIKEKTSQLYHHYSNVINDLIYFNSLTPACSRKYWEYFLKSDGFLSIGSFSEAFAHSQALQLVNSKFYDLQTKFMVKFIKILNVFMLEIPNSTIQEDPLKRLVFQLFTKILSTPQRDENDFFFVYQRMFALTAYVFLLKSKKDLAPFNTISDDEVKRLYLVLKFSNKQDAADKLNKLLKRLLEYFLKVDVHLYSEPKASANAKFVEAYFKSSNILLSADTVLFKIITKLVAYLDKLNSLSRAQTPLKEMPGYCIIIEQIDFNLKAIDCQIQQSLKANVEQYSKSAELRLQNMLQKLLNFISRLQECIYSELADLIFSSKMDAFKNQPAYQQLYYKWYHQFLNSLPPGKTELRIFKDVVRYLLFQQDTSLKAFVSKCVTPSKKHIEVPNSNGDTINFTFFHSLKFKVQHLEIQKLFPQPSLQSIPFQIPPEGYFLTKTRAASTIIKWFDQIIDKCNYDDHYWGSFLNKLAKTLWTLSRFARNNCFRQYFNQMLKPCSYQNSKKVKFNRFMEYIDSDLQREIKPANYSSSYQCKTLNEMYDSQYQNSQFWHKDNKEATLRIQLKQPICAKCNGSTSKGYIFQLCYVSTTVLPKIYDIVYKKPILAFTSCQHYLHKQCLPKETELRCKQCKQRFNFLLIPQQTLNETNSDFLIKDSIKEMFNEIKKVLKGWSQQSIQVSILKYLVGFMLLLTSLPDKTHFLISNGRTVRNLFHLLKKWLSLKSSPSFQKNVLSQKFMPKEGSKHEPFISYVTSLLLQALLPISAPSQHQFIPPIQSNQSAYVIQQLINQLTTVQMVFPISYLQLSTAQYQLLKLSPTLQQLYQSNIGQCSCSEKSNKNAFFICLDQHSPNEKVKFCSICLQIRMKQHIKQDHFNETITIRTDTGEIMYFQLEQTRLKKLQMQSVYVNKLRQSFTLGKLKDKSQFQLDKQRYSQVHSQYVSCKYRTHGQLQFI